MIIGSVPSHTSAVCGVVVNRKRDEAVRPRLALGRLMGPGPILIR